MGTGRLFIKYYEIEKSTEKNLHEMNWHYDSQVYMGYEITKLTFSREDSEYSNWSAQEKHPNVVRVDLSLKHSRTGFEYSTFRYAEAYNFDPRSTYMHVKADGKIPGKAEEFAFELAVTPPEEGPNDDVTPAPNPIEHPFPTVGGTNAIGKVTVDDGTVPDWGQPLADAIGRFFNSEWERIEPEENKKELTGYYCVFTWGGKNYAVAGWKAPNEVAGLKDAIQEKEGKEIKDILVIKSNGSTSGGESAEKALIFGSAERAGITIPSDVNISISMLGTNLQSIEINVKKTGNQEKQKVLITFSKTEE